MTLFLDTGNIKLIKKYYDMGIIRGVTTNPTILHKCNVTDIEGQSKKIAELIHPLPLSVELTTNNPEKMIAEATKLSTWANNIVVKVPIHGPEGQLENLKIIHELEKVHKIKVNVTAMMSAQQCYLAAMAGAHYVSLFCGRVNNMGYNSVNELRKLRALLDDFKLDSEIICASTREVLNIVEWLNAGGHIVTVIPELLDKMIVHPYTKETVQQFLHDANR